uniref:Uncharacterized protein n=1 Tax=Arundo donax TaxID=35708 RepID=A0A0A8XSK0_ARUDO
MYLLPVPKYLHFLKLFFRLRSLELNIL